jgi:endonuclease/exonuclease/phosphatase family metal-dependent hydrolase
MLRTKITVFLVSLLFAFPAHAKITIASFNIQVFGVTKASKTDVMNVVADTVSQFDIVAIQEIRDKTGTAIEKLEGMVDVLGTNYVVITGPRLGRTTSKEQYAFMYRSDTIEPVGSVYTYPEPTGTDPFHREPFIARFKTKSGNFDFVLITVHTDPDEATEEIHALDDVLAQARRHFPNEEDFIILGDLNADCTYYDEDQLNPIVDTVWLVSNEADTTVRTTTDCAYDRIIITTQANEDFTGTVEVYRFDQKHTLNNAAALKVSDHYPVYAEFGSDQDQSDTIPIAFVYHGNTKPKSKKFHSPGCRYYDCKTCTDTFTSRDAAISAGYKPCKVCKP